MAKGFLLNKKRLSRKRFFLRSLLVVIAFFLTFGVLIFAAFSVEKFKITGVSIVGQKEIDPEIVKNEVDRLLFKKYLGLVPCDRVFTFPRKAVEANIMEGLKKLESAVVEIGFDRKIRVKITERQPVAIVCAGNSGECMFLDKTGYIYDEAPYFSDGVFVKFEDGRDKKASIGEFLFDASELVRFFNFLNILSGQYNINKVGIKNDVVYEFHVDEGWYLVLDARDNWNESYANFLSSSDEILNDDRKELEYIDLRFGNKVFFKWK
jgi:cell division septal protein FtsQ